MNSKDHQGAVQNGKKGTERVQTKLGKTHVDYWYSKLLKRRYAGRDGVEVEVPYWQIRLKHSGRSMYFNLATANAAEAVVKARDIYIFLKANGWSATLEKFKPQRETAQSDDLSVQEFVELYRKEVEFVEYPPMPRSLERYVGCFMIVCRVAAVKRLLGLTPEKIASFKRRYIKRGLKKGREESRVKRTCNSHLRGAAALFSRQMLKAYQQSGYDLVNPFIGQNLRRIELTPYTPLRRDLLDTIWRDSAKLRDGDPGAPPPPPRNKGGRPKKGAPKRAPRKEVRWKEPDWRIPQPEAYQILLQELGLGLRREESDKSEWDWFFVLNERRYLEVRKTEFFTPKGKRRRILPVEEVLWQALQEVRQENAQFVVPGNAPLNYTRENTPKNIPYRCERAHRVLVAWLRKKGINDPRPCHLLRKEFGSYVATSFGLFAAQRLLGHSSPSVTEAFYAGLTDLPELSHAQPPQPALSGVRDCQVAGRAHEDSK
jgi:integrase